jgi:hypothetical protein
MFSALRAVVMKHHKVSAEEMKIPYDFREKNDAKT